MFFKDWYHVHLLELIGAKEKKCSKSVFYRCFDRGQFKIRVNIWIIIQLYCLPIESKKNNETILRYMGEAPILTHMYQWRMQRIAKGGR